MSTDHPARRCVAALVLSALALGCGGDDADGSVADAAAGDADITDTDPAESDPAETDPVESGPDADHGCAPTELSFTNEAAGLNGTATAALARSTFDGGLFEVHVGDFDLTADDLGSWRPEVPAGANVVTIQLTVFNASDDPAPIEPGASLELTIEPDELTFLVRHFTADDDWSAAENIGTVSTGSLDVTAVGDAFCFDIDYRDQDKTVAGSVAATVFERR